MRVGIPQALLYYKYFPAWKRFLTELGADVVTSPETNKEIVNMGVSEAENETCLPVKVYYGHALDLKDKVDAIFVPRVVSVEKLTYTCPKFLGLPDMISAATKNLKVIAPLFDNKLGLRRFYDELFAVGAEFSKKPWQVLLAWRKATTAQKTYNKKLESGLTPGEIFTKKQSSNGKNGLTVGVVGHPYNLYDKYTSLNLLDRLKKKGARVLTPETVSPRIAEQEAALLPKNLFWSYEREVVGSAFYWLHRKSVDGVIYMLSFACGPDSLIQVLLENEAKKMDGIPLMPLVIDEHSGESGLVTRVEAFVDMLERKKV